MIQEHDLNSERYRDIVLSIPEWVSDDELVYLLSAAISAYGESLRERGFLMEWFTRDAAEA